MDDREHEISLAAADTQRLRDWLLSPNGSFRVSPRVSFEAVSGGGILVRTQPFSGSVSEYETFLSESWPRPAAGSAFTSRREATRYIEYYEHTSVSLSQASTPALASDYQGTTRRSAQGMSRKKMIEEILGVYFPRIEAAREMAGGPAEGDV